MLTSLTHQAYSNRNCRHQAPVIVHCLAKFLTFGLSIAHSGLKKRFGFGRYGVSFLYKLSEYQHLCETKLLSSVYCCRGYTALYYWLAIPAKEFVSLNYWYMITDTQESTEHPWVQHSGNRQNPQCHRSYQESGWTTHSLTSIHQITSHPQRS